MNELAHPIIESIFPVILKVMSIFSMYETKRSLRKGKLKVNRASETELKTKERKAVDKTENKKKKNNKKQHLATFKRLK